MEGVFGGAGDPQSPFDGFFGNRGGRGFAAHTPRKGRNIINPMTLTFEEAALGGEKQFTILRDGKTESTSVKIPAGISAGKKLRLAGKGQPGLNGGKPGDLFFKIEVMDHPVFIREGNDILMDHEIKLTEAILGTTIQVSTLEGMKQVKVPPETQTNAKLRLKGQGINPANSNKKGDQIIRLIVTIPKNLTPEQVDLVKQLQLAGY